MSRAISTVGEIRRAALKPLIGKIEPIPGECLMSVMARAAVKNVFPRVGEMLEQAGIHARRPEHIAFTRTEAAADLARFISCDPAVIESLMHVPFPRNGLAEAINWYGTPLPRRYITTDRRYSPASLRTSEYGRAIWHIRPLTFCPESAERLVERCFNCCATVGWRIRRGFHVCDSCGSSIRRGRPGKIDWGLRADATAAATLIHPDPKIRAFALERLPMPFRAWEPGDVFAAAVELSSLISFPNRGQHPVAQFNETNLVAGYSLVLGWPDSFHELLKRITDGRRGEIRTLLGPLGRFFITTCTATPLRNLVRENVPELLRTGTIKIASYRGIRSAWLSGNSYVNEKQAEKEFGVQRAIIRRLSGKGECFVSRRDENRGASLYEKDKLRSSTALLKDSVRTHQCATTLGVAAYCVDAIAATHLLTKIEDHDALILAGEPIYTRPSLDALVQRLTALELGSTTDRLSLTTALCGQLNPHLWAAVIKAVADRNIAAVRQTFGTSAILTDVFVEQSRVIKFLSQLSVPPIAADAVVSCMGAQKALGICNVLLGGTVASGLLRAEKTSRGMMIHVRDLAAFDRTYLFVGQISKQVGIGSNHISRALQQAGMQPAARFYKTSVWRRSDVKKLYPGFSAVG